MGSYKKSIKEMLFCLVILISNHLELHAQVKPTGNPLSLEVELTNQNGMVVKQGGIVYEYDEIKGLLYFNEKKWDGKSRYYCYVFHYNDAENDIQMAYPLGDDLGNNRLPYLQDGKVISRVKLFDGTITPPFGKDNFVLVVTEEPLNTEELFNKRGALRNAENTRDELLKLIKGSKLSYFNQGNFGKVQVETMQIESRPASEKKGILQSGNGKTLFALDDSSELFSTPVPQKDIIRDSFPIIQIIDPALENNMKGAQVISSGAGRKIIVRGIAVDKRCAIRSVMINGQSPDKYMPETGYFDMLLEPKEGANRIDVAVQNKNGFTRTIRLQFQFQGALGAVSEQGKDYLLVIGINNYKAWPRLNNAHKDAADFCRMMKEHFGFSAGNTKEIYDEDATQRNIYAELRNYVSQLKSNDRLLVYFSGHGYYDSTLEMGYWIPADAGLNANEQYLNNVDITRMIQKMRAKNIFVIADACYAGQLLREFQNSNKGDYKSRMVLCSGKLKPVSDGKPGENSPFAQKLLDFIANNSGKELLASELIQDIKKVFAHAGAQHPVGGAIDEVGDENGDFVLTRVH